MESNTLVGLSNGLADAVERAARAVVAVNARQRTPSSGVVWRPGVIVTADHTLKREEEITVVLPDGKSAPATLAGRDPGTDLAVLRAEGYQGPVAELANASLKAGHMVLAVGRGGAGALASLGVISSVGGPWRTWRGGAVDQLIRLDLALYPGLSGSALTITDGRIAGINTSGLSRTMGVAIPAATVSRVADELLRSGRISRGYLGVGLHPVRFPDHLKSKLGLAGGAGLVVLTAEPGGPADQAGIVIGDILISIDGSPVEDTDDVQAALGPERVGKPVQVTLVRGGTRTDVTVTVGERGQER
jgi:S1-C subfamily serine protease